MKLFPSRKKAAKDGFQALSHPEEAEDDSDPVKALRDLDKDASNSKRKIRSMMSSLSPFRAQRPPSKEVITHIPDRGVKLTPRDMIIDTATTESLSYSRSIDVNDYAVEEDMVDEDLGTPVKDPNHDAVVTGETTFTSSVTALPSADEGRAPPALISITSFESSALQQASPKKPIFSMQQQIPSLPKVPPRIQRSKLSPENILAAAVAAEIPDTKTEEVHEPMDGHAEKPRYSYDVLSGPMFDTPVRKYIFSDRSEDFSVSDSTCGSSVSLQEELSSLLFNLDDDDNNKPSALGKSPVELDTSTVHSIEHAGDESVYSTGDVIGSFGTFETGATRSFDDRIEKDWELPPNMPHFVKTLAVAMQELVEQVGNCSSYTMEQARQVEWVESLELRANKAVCDLQALAPTTAAKPRERSNRKRR